MKKAFSFAAVLMLLTLGFTGCEEAPGEDSGKGTGFDNTSLRINNQSSYTLLQVNYAGVSFGTVASSKAVSKDVPEGTDRISFRLESPAGNFNCKTNDVMICVYGVGNEFVFTNNTLAEKTGDGEVDTVKNISTVPASFELSQDGAIINRLGEFRFGTILTGKFSQAVFTIRNTGGENIIIESVGGRLVNLENNSQNNFILTQPSMSTIIPNGTTTFRIAFYPAVAQDNLNATVNIKTNIRNNELFSFDIKGNGKDYYVVGDEGPAGGFIFYDAGAEINGFRFLEAAPSITEKTAPWGANGSNVAGTQTAVGTGKQNTVIIVTWLDLEGETEKAAQICNDMVYKGFNDWFLPSSGELDYMYKNLKEKGLGGFGSGNYWSSSQYYENYAYGVNFSNGSVYNGAKYTYNESRHTVRAIRAF